MNSAVLSSQDGEVDMKLLTKVLASEQDVKEVGEFLVNIAPSPASKGLSSCFWHPGRLLLCLSGNQDL